MEMPTLKTISEIAIIIYLILSVVCAMFFPNIQLIIAIFGIGAGFMFARKHLESEWQAKYIALLEKQK